MGGVLHLVLMLLLAEISAAAPPPAPPLEAMTSGISWHEVPGPLRNAWLRFHQEQWCLGIDTVFIFRPAGMEVWCRIASERNFQSFKSLLQPLEKSFRIDLYPTIAAKEKKPWKPEDEDPPPSLWNNGELRSYLRDPLMSRLGSIDEWPVTREGDSSAEGSLKKRMKLFADQTIEWVQKMNRFGGELPVLAEAAYAPDAPADLRDFAATVCREHAREIARNVDRLIDNLGHAFPREGRDAGRRESSPKVASPATPLDGALLCSEQIQKLAHDITRFIYPQSFTVALGELRGSKLLDSLKLAQQNLSEFDRLAGRAR